MEGAAIMRRYCENLLNVFVPISAARLIEEWGSERSATRDVGN